MKQLNRGWYGWRPDTPDQRDHEYRPKLIRLPRKVDLEKYCPPVMDQGSLGSCTAHGASVAIRYERNTAGLEDIAFSRLQLYYDTRWLENTINEDAGAEIRDVIKTLSKKGVGHETLWPYVVSKYRTKPGAAVYKDAYRFRALKYSRVQVNASAIKQALVNSDIVIIGISVYESFESAKVEKTGMVPMPKKDEQMVGGHCMAVIGYGQHKGYFKVRNSWGKSWGDKGNCYIPEAYLSSSNLGSDYWVISAFGA
jgi:C1A family cysteine protease